MKALVSTFNQEKALVGAFSVIVKSSRNLRSSSDDTLLCAGGMSGASVGASLLKHRRGSHGPGLGSVKVKTTGIIISTN